MIRKAKKPAAPGQPPHSHEGTLKRLIFFAYDPGQESVAIGPLKAKRGEAPKALEFGGQVTVTLRVSRSGKRTTKQRRVRVRPHPFMGPALEKERPKLAGAWRATVNSA